MVRVHGRGRAPRLESQSIIAASRSLMVTHPGIPRGHKSRVADIVAWRQYGSSSACWRSGPVAARTGCRKLRPHTCGNGTALRHCKGFCSGDCSQAFGSAPCFSKRDSLAGSAPRGKIVFEMMHANTVPWWTTTRTDSPGSSISYGPGNARGSCRSLSRRLSALAPPPY